MPVEIGGKLFDTFARINPLGASFTTAVTQMVQHNSRRVSLFIENPSAVSVMLHHLAEVTATNGIVLAANGGSYSLTFRDDPALVGLPVFGITSSGTQTLFVVEDVLGVSWEHVAEVLAQK